MTKIRQLAVVLSVAVFLFAQAGRVVRADDWPQWQGPDRSNVSKETGLMKTWPKDGPKLLWTFEKAGFANPRIFGIEGPGWLFPDVQERMSDPRRRADLLLAARMVESEPSLIGLSAHLLVVAQKS